MFHHCHDEHKNRTDETGVSLPSRARPSDEEDDSDNDLYVLSAVNGSRMDVVDPGAWYGPLNILCYWASKQHEYPIISRIARNHLTIPTTSAASERCFSVGGDIITKKKKHLFPGTARYLSLSQEVGCHAEGSDDEVR